MSAYVVIGEAGRGLTSRLASSLAAMERHGIFGIPSPIFTRIMLIKQGVKGACVERVDWVIVWLAGYGESETYRVVDEFFAQATLIGLNVELIKGVICGILVEDTGGPLAQKVRHVGRMIDQVGRGKR